MQNSKNEGLPILTKKYIGVYEIKTQHYCFTLGAITSTFIALGLVGYCLFLDAKQENNFLKKAFLLFWP